MNSEKKHQFKYVKYDFGNTVKIIEAEKSILSKGYLALQARITQEHF